MAAGQKHQTLQSVTHEGMRLFGAVTWRLMKGYDTHSGLSQEKKAQGGNKRQRVPRSQAAAQRSLRRSH